jgi:hypothetical protein
VGYLNQVSFSHANFVPVYGAMIMNVEANSYHDMQFERMLKVIGEDGR